MTLGTDRRDRLRAIARRVRAIPGRDFGIREHSVALVVSTTTGTHTGDGTRTDAVTAITEADSQPPKVRWLNGEELAVGQLAPGTVEVGPITPSAALDALLRSDAMTRGQVVLLRITGPAHPSGADYEITDVEFDRAIHRTIQAKPVGSQE